MEYFTISSQVSWQLLLVPHAQCCSYRLKRCILNLKGEFGNFKKMNNFHKSRVKLIEFVKKKKNWKFQTFLLDRGENQMLQHSGMLTWQSSQLDTNLLSWFCSYRNGFVTALHYYQVPFTLLFLLITEQQRRHICAIFWH